MPKKKDAAIIGVVLLLAVALFAVSKMMPKTDLSTKTADVPLAPDAVVYLDETPAPEATAEPQPTEAPEITAEPQPTEAPEITAEPTAAPENIVPTSLSSPSPSAWIFWTRGTATAWRPSCPASARRTSP